jgi:hypothetical protein
MRKPEVIEDQKVIKTKIARDEILAIFLLYNKIVNKRRIKLWKKHLTRKYMKYR